MLEKYPRHGLKTLLIQASCTPVGGSDFHLGGFVAVDIVQAFPEAGTVQQGKTRSKGDTAGTSRYL